MRARGDSSATSVIDTLLMPLAGHKRPDGGSPFRAALGQDKRILSGGPLSDTTSRPKIFDPSTPPSHTFPLALRTL